MTIQVKAIAEEWMPYRSGDSLLRLPDSTESTLTIETLAAGGSVWRTRKGSSYIKGKLEDYRRWETSENVVTHVQVKDSGMKIYFLRTYGLESWIVRQAAS